MTATIKETRQERDTRFQRIWKEAVNAGLAAGTDVTPRPMVVSNPGTGQQWRVAGGVCGFAWIHVYNGNSPFVRWLKKMGHASKRMGQPGFEIWVSQFGQSMERKMAYADAMAAIFCSHDIQAYSGSRID